MRNIFKNFSKNETEQKNTKPYGYKEMKSIYSKYLGKGMFLSIAFHSVIIGALVYSIRSKPLEPVDMPQVRQVVINDINIPEPLKEDKVEEVTEVPKGTTKVPLKNDNALTPVPVKQDKSTVKTTSTQSELNNINTPVSSNGDPNASNNGNVGTENGNNNAPPKEPTTVEKPVVKENPNKIYNPFEVDRAPQQLNLNSVKSSMQYPPLARETNTEGKVTAKVLVGKDGNVIKVGSITGSDLFKDEVSSKVMDLRFTPAMQNGEAVNCWVTVPFSFTLK